MWHVILKVFLKGNRCGRKKRGNPWYRYQFLALLGSLGTHFSIYSNKGMWHLIWKIFLKKWKVRKREEFDYIDISFWPYFMTHFSTHSNSVIWHLIWKIFLKEKRWERKKEEIDDNNNRFVPFRVLRAPFYTQFSIPSNSGKWHLVWKIFLKEKQWKRKKIERII